MRYLQRVEEEIILHITKRRKVNSIGHFLPRDCFLTNVNEGKNVWEDEDEGVRNYWMILKKEKILAIERGRTRSHCVENLLWKRLWTWRKTQRNEGISCIHLLESRTYAKCGDPKTTDPWAKTVTWNLGQTKKTATQWARQFGKTTFRGSLV
jgi:hypothetical protein